MMQNFEVETPVKRELLRRNMLKSLERKALLLSVMEELTDEFNGKTGLTGDDVRRTIVDYINRIV